MSLNTKQKQFISLAKETFNADVLTTSQLKEINQKFEFEVCTPMDY